MSDGPLVTCIVPVYNGERFLAETLATALAQTHRPIEVLVVDDGSTDASAAIAEALGPPVRVLRRENGGAAAARNTGILAAAGAFVAFLDADDLCLPERLAVQVGRLAARPEADVSLVTVENFWEPGMEEEEARYRRAGKLRATHGLGCVLARRELFDRIGLLDGTLRHSDHLEFFARLRTAGVVLDVCHDVLVRRRMHPESTSHRVQTDHEHLAVLKAHLDRRRAAGTL